MLITDVRNAVISSLQEMKEEFLFVFCHIARHCHLLDNLNSRNSLSAPVEVCHINTTLELAVVCCLVKLFWS